MQRAKQLVKQTITARRIGRKKMSPHVFMLAFLIAILSDPEASVAADPCQRKCGDIEIPYPFGMTQGCYLDKTFEIACNESTGTAKLVWPNLEGIKVHHISIPTHSLLLKNDIFPELSFKKSGERLYGHNFYLDFSGSHYYVSPLRNKFIATGCDFYAYFVDRETKEFLGGCAPLCNRTDIVPLPSSPCSDLHCCEIILPKEIRNITLWVQTMDTWTNSWGNHCVFYNFVDKDFLQHNKISFTSCHEYYHLPIRVKWAVGSTSCDKARGREDYVCGQNTECTDAATGKEYRCKCRHGYDGNPYTREGCQDIDECADKKYNNCSDNNRCINTEGNYICLPNRSFLIKLPVIISLGVCIAVSLLILTAVGFWGWRKLNKKIKERKMKQKFFKKNGGLLLQQQLSSRSGSGSGSMLPELTLFTIEELETATDKFSENRILGKGGLGTVYKGMISDGRIVAVKKANIIDESQVNQFINEVFILSQINHRHIVKLYGCCLETQVPLLVYDYISNGTLSHHLHDEPNICTISWVDRLRIAAEVAGALAYLHSSASTAIFHRDIKSSNILLDEKYKAVISDFGLSRSVSIDKTHLTTFVGGTFGYLDPEYFRSGQLNDKSDVYAFGVVLAEILTGQKAISSTKDDIGLVIRFRSAVKEQRLFEILDEAVEHEGQKEEILAVAKLAKRCLKINARKRPSMKEVAAELDQLKKTKECLQHVESFTDKHDLLKENSCSCSINSEVEDDQTMSKTN